MNMKKFSGLVATGLFLTASTISAATITAETLKALGFTDAQIAILLPMLNGNSNTSATTTTSATTEKTYVYTRLLKVGKRGDDVKALQSCLNRLGNNTGVVDGIFGRNTKAGVISFQRAHGLVADGIIGPKTGPKFEEACAITTTTTTTDNTTTTDDNQVTGDKLVVSGVASDDMIVGTGQRVVFAKLTVTAGDDDVKIKKVNVKYEGTADKDVINEVEILDSSYLVVDGDRLDSDAEASVRPDVVVKAGETKTLYLAALTSDFTDADGLDGTLTITSIETDGADVEGTPIQGASHEFNANAEVATYKITTEQDETGTVRIGEKVDFDTINIENDDKDDNPEIVKAIKIVKTGTSGDDDIKNLEIKVKGKYYKAVQDPDDSDKYIIDFGDGIKLDEKGDDEDFVLYGKVDDGEGNTIGFDVDSVTVLDEDGVILKPSLNSEDLTSGGTVTIETSKVRISKTTDVSGHKVAADTKGVELASFETDVDGSNVTGDVTFRIEATTNATDLSDIDIDNIAIYTEDGDLVSDKEDASFEQDSNTDTIYANVTIDDVEFKDKGNAVKYVVKGDISKDAPDGTKYEIIQIKYTNIEDEDGNDIDDVTEDISATSAATIEVEGADLDVSIKDVDDQDVNSDTDNVAIAKINVDATNSGDDIDLTKLKLKFTLTDADNTSKALSLDDVTNCEIFDGDESVSSTEDLSGTGLEDTVTFDIDDLTIRKETEKDLILKCDLSSNFEDGDAIKVEAAVSSDNTPDFEAKGENTDTDVDNDITGDTTVTVTDGTLEVTLSSDDINDDKVVKDSSSDVVFGEYKIKAKDRELKLDTVKVTFDSKNNSGDAIDTSEVIDGKVKLYIDGEEEDSEDVIDNVVEFTNLDYTIEKDQTVVLRFVADTKANADNVSTNVKEVDAETVEDIVANDFDGKTTDAAGAVTVVTAIPQVTQVDTNSSDLETADDVVLFTYKVKAEGGNVTMKNTVFNVTATNADLTNVKVKVYDNASMSGSKKFEADLDDLAAGTTANYDVDLSSVQVDENDTYYVFLIADVRATDDIRSIDVKVADEVYSANTEGFTFTTPNLDGSKLIDDDMKSLLKKD